MRRVILALLCLVPATALAQPVALTLDEAVTRGLAASARLEEARARERAAAAQVDGRQAQARPTVGLQTGYLRTNHVDEFGVVRPDGSLNVLFPDIPDNIRLRAELLYPVWTAGRTTALTEAASADAGAAAADTRVAEADLALEIAAVYWQLVTARAAVAVLDDALTRADAWVRDVQARVDAGVSSPHEVPQAAAQRARQRVQQLQAAQAAAMAERELVRLTGLPPGTTVTTVTPVETAAEGADRLTLASASSVYGQALESRAERTALDRRAAAFRAAARAAWSSTRPQVGALAAIEPARPNARFVPRTATWHVSWDLGVTLTWSLWDGGRARADRAAAMAQAAALEHRQREFDSRLEAEIAQRLSDLDTGRAAVAASAEAVAAAAEVHRVMRVRFDAGVATSTEVLDAHVAWLEAALEQTRLQASLRLAEARLRRATGAAWR